MQAIILAAGMGKRLKKLTKNNTKCMVEVNGVTLIERTLRQLDDLKLNQIVIVVGYESQKLIDYIETLNINTPIIFVNNSIYNKTNNIYSLYLAKEYLIKDDTLLLESDIIFEDGILQSLVNDSRETLALVDKYESWMDGTCLKINEKDLITSFVSKKDFNYDEKNNYYKTVNIYKLSKQFSSKFYIPALEAYQKEFGTNEYYETVLKVILYKDNSIIKAKRLDGELWYEIDDLQDLDIAESLFESDENKKLSKITSRYGGYWRYPKLIDFCYLVNPYYPSSKLKEEMIASFDKLITNYPSSMDVNCLLASKNFNVNKEHIVVGNGAAELINYLMRKLQGKTGFIKPTFEEYPNRYSKEKSVTFFPSDEDFKYNGKEIIKFFSKNKVDNLVLINPDNPSGNFISKKELIDLAEWTKNNNINFILDESFIDFAEDSYTMISEEVINNYSNLIIIKSISKSYGIPGVRLGILVSSNERLIKEINKNISIWNINSFGEFWMQIAEKYKNDYLDSLDKFKITRSNFINELNKIQNIRAIPSQSNYVMVEIKGKYSARELTINLYTKYNILIKDLTNKVKNNNKEYVRLAIKNDEDNNKLIKILKKELND